jgi:hypothetical protein
MKTNIPFVVFSAEKAGFSADVNAWRTQSAEFQLRNMAGKPDFIFVEGKYKNSCETSFLVLLPQGDATYAFHQLLRLASRWGQESVLYVDANRQATLVYLGTNGLVARMEYVGAWMEIDKEQRAAFDAYTAYNNRYFVTRRAG